MRKPSSRPLKVFAARIGFYDTVVAAPSQAAALRAWGVHRDLFADGDAQPATDPAAVAAARAHPEIPLKRPVGSAGGFEVDPSGLPNVPDAPKPRPKPAAPAWVKPKARPAPPPADRSALTRTEAALQALDEGRKTEEAKLRRRQADLDVERSAAQDAYVDARKAAATAVVEARAAYRKASGGD